MRGISEFTSTENEKGHVLNFNILTRWYFPISGGIFPAYIQADIVGPR